MVERVVLRKCSSYSVLLGSWIIRAGCVRNHEKLLYDRGERIFYSHTTVMETTDAPYTW